MPVQTLGVVCLRESFTIQGLPATMMDLLREEALVCRGGRGQMVMAPIASSRMSSIKTKVMGTQI
jgi:hypothetical protein